MKIKLFASHLFLVLGFTVFFLTSCKNNEPKNDIDYTELISKAGALFQPIHNFPENSENELTEEKIKLGKTLFFDNRLSLNNTQSCNTCHDLNTFGVDNLPTSPGDLGKNGNRNSPTVLNAAFHFKQFWDGRAEDVEEQAGGPILNPVEMNMPSADFVINRLKGIQGYQALFKAAFPDSKDPFTYDHITKAIGAFERTLVTPSRFDQFLNGKQDALTPLEKKGMITFLDVGCATCHNGAAIGGNVFQKFPLYGNHYKDYTGSKKEDLGRQEETRNEADKFIFKVPGLRNVSKTAPYFHDGSVEDLHQAVAIMGKLQLNKDLTEDEVHSIVAFLNALTGSLPEQVAQKPEMPI